MKVNFKRILATLLVLCMVLSMLPVMASAATYQHPITGTVDVNGTARTITYTLDYDTSTDTLTLTAPSEIDGIPFDSWSGNVTMTSPIAGSIAFPIFSGNTACFVTGNVTQTEAFLALNDEQWAAIDATVLNGAVYKSYHTLTVNGSAESNIPYGETRILPAAPEAPEGQRFIGWSEDPTGGLFQAGTTITIDGDRTFNPYFIDKDEAFLAIFADLEGNIVGFERSDAEGKVTAPALPTSAKYTYTDWDTDTTAPLTEDVIIKAVGTLKSYTVTYQEPYVPGSVASPSGTATAAVDSIVSFDAVATAGYKISGAAGLTAGNKIIPIAYDGDDSFSFTMPADDLTVYIYVVKEAYTASYYADGVLVEQVSLTDGQALPLPEAPAKEGYTFDGWYGESGTKLQTGDTIDGDVKFTAKYIINTNDITVAPMLHGNLTVVTNLPDGLADVPFGTPVALEAVAGSGYELSMIAALDTTNNAFVPIYMMSATVGFFYMPDGDVTVAATEAPADNLIRFNVDGELYAFNYCKTGDTPVAPAAPEKEGYTFNGWFNGDEALSDTTVITEDTTYEADFIVNPYDLTYYRGVEADESEFKCFLTLPDGTVVEFFNNDTLDMPTYVVEDIDYGTKVVLGEASLPGYTFKYWLDEDGGIHPAGSNFEIKGDSLLTAVWEADTELSCFVSFNTDDGIFAGFLAYDGQDATIPATEPVQDGKIFKGWEYAGNTYSNDGVKDFTVIADADRMMIFTAVWEELEFSVTMDDTMGNVDTIDSLYYGDEFVLPPAPYMEGYTFVAWQDQLNGAYYMENGRFVVERDYEFVAVFAEDEAEQYLVKFFDENGNLYDFFTVVDGDSLNAPIYDQGRPDCSYVWRMMIDSPEIYVQGGNTIGTVHEDMNFQAVMDGEETYKVNVTVLPADAPANVATVPAPIYELGETAQIEITVPDGYFLKAVNAEANGKAVIDNLLMLDDNQFLYLVTVPMADVDVIIILEEIPAGYSVVKFVNDGDLYAIELVQKGTNATAPAVAPSKDGFAFIEWRTDSGFVGAGGNYAVALDAADEIIYNAIYQAETYKVHFNLDGGTPDYVDLTDVLYKDTVTLYGAPSKDGYEFVGWREDATGITYGANANYVVTADADFTAIWTAAECVVRFIDPDSSILYGYEEVSEGNQVSAPEAPSVAGKTFLYWENKENATDRVSAGTLTPNILEDTVYFARYEVSNHNITVVTDRCEVALNVTGAVEVGTEITFTATPNEGCAIDSVVLTYTDGLSPVVRELHPDAAGIYTFTMPDADVTITAKAVQNVFSIFKNPDAKTQITVTGDKNKAEIGETVSFTAEPNDTDYVLSEVYVFTESGAPIALTIANGKYIFTMPAEDVTISATSVKAELTVTYLDSDNTLLGIVPVASGELAEAPVPTKEGYTFVRWEILPLTNPALDFDPATDAVTKNLVVRAVYVGDTFTVEAGLDDHLEILKASCTISSGNVNSAILKDGVLLAEAGKDVYVTVAASYDYLISGVAIVGLNGSKTIIEPTLRLKETVNGINYYTVTFPMPAEDVKIDVYTVAKMFRVDVEENVPFAGEYTLNGFYTNNLMIPQGDNVTIDIAPIPGYEVVDVTGTFFDGVSEVSLVDFYLSPDKTQFSFPMVARDVFVYITYAPIEYAIDIQTSNFETYKPDSSVNPAVVVESLNPELTSQGRIEMDPYAEDDYTNALGQIYKIPANGTQIADNRVYFRVVEYTGYDLDTLNVYYADFEKTCPITKLADGRYCFDMPADDVVIIATFVPETYKVSKDAASEAHGQVELNGLIENAITASYKDEITVTVTPDDGYQVSKIYYELEDGTVMDFDAASYENATVLSDTLDVTQSISFHMPATNVKVFVEYLAIDYSIADVTAEATTTYTTPYKVGQLVTFNTVANYGYTIERVYVINDTTGEHIDRFTDSINGTYGADYYFTMPASSVTIHVETIKDIYQVEYRDNGDLVGGENIPYLETANVTAFTPLIDDGRPGYHFVGWTSQDTQTPVLTPSNDNADFVIIQNTTIIAAYEKDEIDVHFLATENGTVTELSTGNTAEYLLVTTVFGDVVKFTAEPDEGYEIDTVRVYTTNADGYVLDLSCAVSGNEYTFTIPASFKADIREVEAAEVVVSVTFKKATFTLTKAADCGTDGEISVNGSVATETSFEYLYQDAVNITAVPNNGYYVASITAVNADGTVKFEELGTKPAADTPAGDALTLNFNMPACDLTYTVVYEKIDYTITCVYDAVKGKAETDLTPTAQIDDIVTITVTPNEGYELVELTVTYADGEKSCVLTKIAENVYTFTMPADDVVVTALFDVLTYTANLEVVGEGDATLNGYYTDNMAADYLSTVTVNAAPAEGWKLTGIKVDGGAITVKEEIKAEGGDYTFTMPAHDVDIVVTFERIDYTVTCVFDAVKGKAEAVAIAQVGDIVTVTVTPNEGYELVELTATYADGEKSCVLTKIAENVYTFTMPADDVVVTALFDVLTYTANLEVVGEGDATLNGYYTDNMAADYLSTVTVNAAPAEGWKLTGIKVDGGAITVKEEIKAEGGDYTFTMPAHDVDIVVTFEKIDYTVSSFALNFFENGHGTVTLTPADTAKVGDNVIITADPDDGYRVKEVVVVDDAGVAVPAACLSIGREPDYVETWSFTMPAKNVEIYVTFEVHGGSYYDDVRTDDWSYEAVTFVTDRGYFFGIEKDLFGPNVCMNRAMFVTVIGRMAKVDTSAYTGAAFPDVDTGAYYAPYVQWAAEKGIVLGIDENTFAPDALITREQMAAMMYRYCQFAGMDMSLQNQDFLDRYTDLGEISGWALEYVKWAVGTGLIHGRTPSTINPLENATRAEVAQIIKNLCDKVFFQ